MSETERFDSKERLGSVIRFVLVVAVVGVATISRADERVSCYRPQDEIWVIDTCAADCRSMQLSVERFDGRSRWLPAGVDEFVAAHDAEMPTLIWVHGNRVNAGEARDRGLAVYQALTRQAVGDGAVRFVVFVWPAAQTGGLLQDARVKAARTDPAGYQLAWVVNQLPPDAEVGMLGFSFGGRIITGALHLLSGHDMKGYALDVAHADRRPVRSVLWAPAVDAAWLAEGGPHGMALAPSDQMLLLNNSCDRALRFYHLISRCRPRALGYYGFPLMSSRAAGAEKVLQHDVCCYVGRDHSSSRYLQSQHILALTWDGLMHRGETVPTAQVAAK